MDSSDWAGLPKHLLDSVVERLPSVSDYERFSEVCTSWKLVADDNRCKRTAPTLLSYTGQGQRWNFCNIADDKVHDFHIALPNKRFCASRGWLITMNEDFTVSLINPLSRLDGRKLKANSIINLPALNLPALNIRKTSRCWSRHANSITIPALNITHPILNADDCIVMVIYGGSEQLAFIRLGKDTRWTHFLSDHYCFEEVRYVGDKFYALNTSKEKSKLFSIDITAQFNEEEDVMLVAKDSFEQQEEGFVRRYLVELTGNELVMIKKYMYYHPRLRHFRETRKFELFKLDRDGSEWTEINNIGDIALFLGESSSISVLAASSKGYLPNCIYYLHDWDYYRSVFGNPDDRDFGVYDIENKTFSRAKDPSVGMVAAAGLMKMSNQFPIWTVL